MNSQIADAIRQKGLLLEKEIYDLLENFEDSGGAIEFLDSLEKISGQKIITKSILTKNYGFVKKTVNNLPDGSKSRVENIFVKLGLSVEIKKEMEVVNQKERISGQKFQIFYADTKTDKKLEVKDFTGNFRARYQQIQKILIQRPELSNLVSINKISGERQNLSIIGIVVKKNTTKNKNLIITFEDLTGEINTLVKFDRKEIFEKADELQLDDVVGIKASGNKEMLFVQDIFYPDAFLFDKTRFNEDTNIAFLSDIHAGSTLHLKKEMERFLEWINSEDEIAKKIKYIFIIGDNVDGVGIYPSQEALIELKSMKEQYALLAGYLKRIPKYITIFMCPGQHDAVRVAEPQPIIGRHYASDLYEIENLVLVTNPTMVKLLEGDKEFRVLMYHGASVHTLINEIKELREIKAHKTPAKAVKHMLKRRHLATTHSSVVYIPNAEKDPLVISEVPDILCIGEVHKLDVETYNGVLVITGSCWQSTTPYEERVGNVPDPAKVSVFNLKTRELKILDFNEPMGAGQ